MGSVYRAVHLELGTPVAVKLIDPTVAQSKMAVARFKREAQAAASIRSNHVVQILDYGIDDETPYIVMELLEGESLAARISRQSVLPAATVYRILVQVGKALERAHAMNIVHRDLKPDNIFLLPDGEDVVAKVLDFGIAKTETNAVFEASIQTKSGAILGTPHYMSPEQASGRGIIDQRTDIWALGVIVFECFTGFRPFTGSTLGGLVVSICSDPIARPSERGSVPHGLDAWFAKAVCRNKDERFSSMNEAIAGLKQVCEPREGASLEYSLGGLRREPTAIVTDVSSGTVSPSSHTVGSVDKRRHYAAWATVSTLLVILGVGSFVARSRALGFFAGVTPRTSVIPSASPAAGSIVSVGSRDVPNVVSAAVSGPVANAVPSVASVITSVPDSVSTRAALSVPTVPTGLRVQSNKSSKRVEIPTVEAPLAAATSSSSSKTKPPSVVVEVTRPTTSTQSVRNAEDRLAF
jgi:serine/threonine-protein kinase